GEPAGAPVRSDGARGGPRDPPGQRGAPLLAAGGLHAHGHARTLCDVRGSGGPLPPRPARFRRGRSESWVRRVARRPRARSPVEPPDRRHVRRPGGAFRGAPPRVLPRTALGRACRLADGGVPERTNGTASKAVRASRPSQVRILSPPHLPASSLSRNVGLRAFGRKSVVRL